MCSRSHLSCPTAPTAPPSSTSCWKHKPRPPSTSSPAPSSFISRNETSLISPLHFPTHCRPQTQSSKPSPWQVLRDDLVSLTQCHWDHLLTHAGGKNPGWACPVTSQPGNTLSELPAACDLPPVLEEVNPGRALPVHSSAPPPHGNVGRDPGLDFCWGLDAPRTWDAEP